MFKSTAIRSLYRHVVGSVWVTCKANGDSNQLWALLDSDAIAEKYPQEILFCDTVCQTRRQTLNRRQNFTRSLVITSEI